MNESLLNALMELIALFAKVNNTRFIDNAHSLIKTYLDQNVSIKNSHLNVRKYYNYFETYSGSFPEILTNDYSLKKTINEIVKRINSELNEEERIVLLLSFLELIKLDKKIEQEELVFVEILSEELGISRIDYKNSLLFILCDNVNSTEEFSQDFLIISNKKGESLDELEGSWIEQNRPPEKDKNLFLIKKEFEGEILVLRLQGTNFVACRYFGIQLLHLNNRKIYPGKYFLINQFDQLKIGTNFKFTYLEIIAGYKNSNPNAALRFIGENVSTRSKGDLIGFAPFNFCEEPGSLVVILSNDSHESKNITLLLAGEIPLASGKISFNGYNIHSERYRVHKMIGLVPQENIFDENISIYNNFWFSARLAFPGYSEAKINQLVEQTVTNLGLHEFSHKPIKNIDNVIPAEYLKILINTGVELIRDPFILILDLPFEKLNSLNSEEYCFILKSESNKGKLIFLTSINPGACILRKTDRMWIFDTGGYIIYRGLASNTLNYLKEIGNTISSTEDLCPYCGYINTEHLYQVFHSKIIDKQGKTTKKRKTTPEAWYKIYKEKIEQKETRPESRKVIPSYASSIPDVNIQFNAYFKKHFFSFLSNPQKPLLVLVAGLMLTFLIAGLLRYDWTGNFSFSKHEYLPLLFFLNTVICFITGIVLGLQFTLNDKLVIAFDHFRNYSFFSHLNVKYIFLSVLSLIFSICFTIITDWVSGIHGLFTIDWLIYFSTVFIGGCIGLFFGYTSLRLRNSLFVALILLFLNILFSGYILPYNTLPKQLISDKYIPAFAEVFPGRWAYEALIVEQVKDNPFQKSLFKTEQTISDLTFKTNILMPKLQEELFNIQNKTLSSSRLSLFYKELKNINKKYPDIFQFEFLEELNKRKVSSEILSELEDYLRYAQFQLFENLGESLALRNKLRQNLKDSVGSKNFDNFISSNYNTPLFMFVSAKKSGKNYIENEGEIIQTDDPIFRLPENNFGRSHFFAPQKLMNGYYYETTYFNLFILWLEIFLIYIATLIFRKKSIRALFISN